MLKMAKRLISAAIAVPLAIIILFLDNSIVFLVALSAFSLLAVYEMLVATKYIVNKPIAITCMLFGTALISLFSFEILRPYAPSIAFLFVMILFAILLKMHHKIRFEEVAVMVFVSVCIPLALGTIAFFQMRFEDHGIFYIVFLLLSVWMGDGGAYFIGSAIGKHKMAPTISPKKSWEGFFGGIVFSGISATIACFVYMWIDTIMNGHSTFTINIPYMIVLSLVCSVLGVFGDFTASIIKRQCSVKDFGKLLPGHGGVLDRFDSVLFAGPFLYLLFKLYEPISSII